MLNFAEFNEYWGRSTLLYFVFNQHTALSSRAEVGRQMYFGVSAVGEASLFIQKSSPPFPKISQDFKKCKNGVIFTTLNLIRPRLKMQQDILILNQSC